MTCFGLSMVPLLKSDWPLSVLSGLDSVFLLQFGAVIAQIVLTNVIVDAFQPNYPNKHKVTSLRKRSCSGSKTPRLHWADKNFSWLNLFMICSFAKLCASVTFPKDKCNGYFPSRQILSLEYHRLYFHARGNISGPLGCFVYLEYLTIKLILP